MYEVIMKTIYIKW